MKSETLASTFPVPDEIERPDSEEWAEMEQSSVESLGIWLP
ncbi:hypothetical protein [Allocoleopsis sp.]